MAYVLGDLLIVARRLEHEIWMAVLTRSGACRYFAEACATLGCMVFGVRDGCCAKSGAPVRDYWITDGAPLHCPALTA